MYDGHKCAIYMVLGTNCIAEVEKKERDAVRKQHASHCLAHISPLVLFRPPHGSSYERCHRYHDRSHALDAKIGFLHTTHDSLGDLFNSSADSADFGGSMACQSILSVVDKGTERIISNLI